MINSQRLEGRISESGLKKAYVARMAGLTLQGFLNKINGKSEFRVSEVQAIKTVLSLSQEEVHEIFLI